MRQNKIDFVLGVRMGADGCVCARARARGGGGGGEARSLGAERVHRRHAPAAELEDGLRRVELERRGGGEGNGEELH